MCLLCSAPSDHWCTLAQHRCVCSFQLYYLPQPPPIQSSVCSRGNVSPTIGIWSNLGDWCVPPLHSDILKIEVIRQNSDINTVESKQDVSRICDKYLLLLPSLDSSMPYLGVMLHLLSRENYISVGSQHQGYASTPGWAYSAQTLMHNSSKWWNRAKQSVSMTAALNKQCVCGGKCTAVPTEQESIINSPVHTDMLSEIFVKLKSSSCFEVKWIQSE